MSNIRLDNLEAQRRTPLKAQTIFTRYVLFGLISGLCNIASQQITIVALPDAAVMISILNGTGAGFVVKYLLDKRWIFLDTYENHAAEIRKVLIYGLSAIATTLIFWGVELSFWRIWNTAEAKYTGAVLGLSMGYWIKYRLDRHYVFAGRKG